MKKFINDPNLFEEDSLRGILLAHSDHLVCHPDDLRAIYLSERARDDKVAVVTGGGYGHIPVFLGYVGKGLCDGVAVGNIFSSPSSSSIYRVTKSVAGTAGVLYLLGNYMGDIMNFEMASDLSKADGIRTAVVTVSDDVASAPRSEWRKRRGISGIVFAYKIVGAAASAGMPIDELVCIAEKVIENAASFGIAFASCQLPTTRAPIFEIGEDEMELGIGIHGEKGVRRAKLMTSREIARITVERLAKDLCLSRGDQVALLVNGLGATCYEELYLYFADVSKELNAMGVRHARTLVGEYAASMEMSGASVSLLRLDDELLTLYDAPAYSPFVSFNGGRCL